MRAQKHFRCTIVGPDSSYSALEIHIFWKVLSDDRMEPPIHTEYFRSGGAITLIFIVEGAKAQLLRHALADAGVHRRASREHHVGVEVLADVHVALHDGLEGRVMDAA